MNQRFNWEAFFVGVFSGCAVNMVGWGIGLDGMVIIPLGITSAVVGSTLWEKYQEK
jgi:hypothetical protein